MCFLLRRSAWLSLPLALAACGDVNYDAPDQLPDYVDSPAPPFAYVDPPSDPSPVVYPQHSLAIKVGIATAVTSFGYALEEGDEMTWLPIEYCASGDWWCIPGWMENPPIGPVYVRAVAGTKCYEALIEFNPSVNEGWKVTAGDQWEP